MKKLVLLIAAIISLTAVNAATPADSTIHNDSISSTYHLRQYDLQNTMVGNSFDKVAVAQLGGSATGILSRVSGVVFQSGGLVSVRGLSPRYSSISIDGLSAPITEQNVKAFSLGLLPASAVQGIDVSKSGQYTNSGEWGGANINLSTKATVDEDFNTISFSTGMQQHVTFNNFAQESAYGGFADFMGYGAQSRDFTQDISDRESLQAMSRNEAAAQGALMQNTWGVEQSTAVPNFKLGYTMGRLILDNSALKLHNINSFNFSRVQSGKDSHRAKYTAYERDANDEVIGSSMASYMTDKQYSTVADVSLNSSWTLDMGDDHAINANVSYSHSGDNTVLTRYFIGLASNKEGAYSQIGLTEKELLLGRLSGTHHISDKTDIDWALGAAISNRNEPDLRRTAYQRNLDEPDAAFYLIIPESSKADAGARFSSALHDNFYSGRADLSHDIIDGQFQLKAGFLVETNERDFAARIVTSVKDDFTDPNLRFVEPSELDHTFAPENYGANGYYLVDGTTDYDSYDANSRLLAGYMGSENQWGKRIKTSLGIRFENYAQALNSGDVNVDNNSTDLLPYFNSNWAIDKQSALKLAFSTSVNRPTFRELSPFSFYDFDYRADIQGNPDLENAKLYNVDVNYLYNFGQNEYVSVGGFYKKIDNPIEMVYVVRSDLALFSFENTEAAQVAGVEMEFAKHLTYNAGNPLSNVMLTGNFSYTYSQIDLGEDTREVTSNRPLQGQTPLLGSLAASYQWHNKAQFTLAYAYRGKSLYSVGDGQETYPWYLDAMNSLNAGASYQFKNNMKLKLFATNLLNTPTVLVEDANMNGNLNDTVDKVISRSERYQSYNLTLSYRF